MDSGILLLIGIFGLVVVLAAGEAILRRGQRRRSLTETFGGTAVRKPGTFDEQGMTEESRAALEAQMRLTAQSGVQGLGRHTRGLGSWSVVNPKAMGDPQAYAKMMVPEHARKADLESGPEQTHSPPQIDKEPRR
jgi:hypothetical protein